MSLAARSRLAVASLALLALWPLAHHALAARLQLDPWRYFGFAMYCYPKTDVSVRFLERRGGQRRPISLASLPDSLIPALRRFRADRLTRGRLRPDALAPHLWAASGAEELVIEVWTLHYDVETARFLERVDDYVYRRPGAVAAFRPQAGLRTGRSPRGGGTR